MTNVAAQQKAPELAHDVLIQLPGGLNPVDLWLNLHTAQQAWGRIEDKTQRDNSVASTRLMLESLSDFPVSRWLAFNHAIGWIPAAITATTWCQGATLAHSVSVWNNLALLPQPEPGADFAARLINPALLPENTIMAIGGAANSKYPAGALLIAARDDAPVLDVPDPEALVRRSLPGELSHMLALRGGVPSDWVRPAAAQTAPAPVAEAVPAPEAPSPAREPEHYNATIANMLRQRKTARGWSEDQIGAAMSLSEGVAVSGFQYLKAFRFLLPASARSVVADENGRLLHVGREDYVYTDTYAQSEPAELPPEGSAAETGAAVILVPLFGEFIDVWRPVRAQRIGGAVFQIDQHQEHRADEAWGVNYGPRVECEARRKGDQVMLFFKRDAPARR